MRRIFLIAAFALIAAACGPSSTIAEPTTTESSGVAPTLGGSSSPAWQRPAGPATHPMRGSVDRPTEPAQWQSEPQRDCRPEKFVYPPVDLDAVEYLTPFGMMIDSHVTPIDHQYFQNFKDPEQRIDAYSPADGRVIAIQHFGVPVTEERTGLFDDYRVEIQHTCTVSSTFMHVTSLEPRLAAVAPPLGEYARTDIAVDAGAKIGWFTKNVDFNLVDLDYKADGIVDPSSYEREPWKTHVPDTFDYFVPEIAEQMRSLSLRSVEPRGGVFAWDVDGRLVGNWFEEGTNGYAGVDRDRYWAGHLAFAYDHIDPTMLTISIGTWIERSAQFAIVGNSPDPVTVEVGSGPVIFEVTNWEYWVGNQRWDRISFAEGITAHPSDRVAGSVMVAMLDDRTLLFEKFPGVSRSGVTGFTDAAQRFTR